MIREKVNYSFLSLIKSDLTRFHLLLNDRNDSIASYNYCPWLLIFSPRMAPVLLYRIAHLCHGYGLKILPKLFTCLNFFLFGIEIACSCKIGPGFFIPHSQGTVIGAWNIGANFTVFQGVTIGARTLDFVMSSSRRPVISNNVTIGAGAVVIGPIKLGQNSFVGANSVVLTDIPPNCLAVGAPARIVPSS